MPLFLVLIGSLMAAPPEPDFELLLNGRDLEGWTAGGDETGWIVEEDGVLLTVGTVDGGWLSTDREYADFVLRLEYMLSEVGNSGVLIRGLAPGSADIEVQLLAPWTPYRDDLHCTGSLYGHVAVDPRPDETTGIWHSLEITAIGKSLSVVVDGVEVCRANTDEVPTLAGSALSGHIALQSSHSGPEEWVRFRNIRIRDLDAEPGHLAYQLRSDDPAIRRHAQEFSARLGAAMVPDLLRLHAEGTPESISTAADALTYIVAGSGRDGSDATALSAALARELAGTWPTPTRAFVLEALALVGSSACVPAIAACLDEPVLAHPAASALSRIGGPTAIEALSAAVTGPDLEAALAAVSGLSTMGSGSGLHALASALGAASPVLRASAVTALGSVGTEATAPVIVTALRDGNPAVRAAAHSAVLRLATRLWESDRSTAHLLLERAVDAADSRVARVSALVAAIRLGADDASPALTLGRARDVEAVEEAERIAQTP